MNDYVRHILHLLEVAGEDHVMLGADFIDYQLELVLPKLQSGVRTGIYRAGHMAADGLTGFADLSKIPSLLREAGVADGVVRKVTAANLLRLLSEAHR